MNRMWQINQGGVNYFPNKDAAKEFRDSQPENVRHLLTISKGPDHPRLHDKGNPTTHTNGGNKGDGFRKTAKQRRGKQ